MIGLLQFFGLDFLFLGFDCFGGFGFGKFLAFGNFLFEFVYSTFNISKFLGAGVEGVAVRTNFNINFW